MAASARPRRFGGEDATADIPRQIKRIVEMAAQDGEPQIST
ncbi:MAG: hypothetical protein WBQ20_10525 [Methyloceanibacter sp.]